MASGAECGEQAPLGGDSGLRRTVSDEREDSSRKYVIRPAFDSDRTLSDSRIDRRWRQLARDAMPQPEPRQSGGGENESFVLAFVELA